jgi:hypothetical protein
MQTANFRSSLLLVLCAALVGCSSDPDTFITYTERVAAAPGQSAYQVKRSDELALQYANGVEQLFRSRSTGARYTREGSDATVLGLGAVSAAGSVFSLGASGLSSLGFAQTGIGSMQKFFKADARSTAYREGAERIHAAIKDFMAHNLNDVSPDKLSPNGWTLANIVQANIDIVSKMINGTLPTAEALAQASEKMTTKGAKPQNAGTTPINNIPAGALTPQMHQERVDTYRENVRHITYETHGTTLRSPGDKSVPKLEDYKEEIKGLAGKNGGSEDAPVFKKVFEKAGVDSSKLSGNTLAEKIIDLYSRGTPEQVHKAYQAMNDLNTPD